MNCLRLGVGLRISEWALAQGRSFPRGSCFGFMVRVESVGIGSGSSQPGAPSMEEGVGFGLNRDEVVPGEDLQREIAPGRSFPG